MANWPAQFRVSGQTGCHAIAPRSSARRLPLSEQSVSRRPACDAVPDRSRLRVLWHHLSAGWVPTGQVRAHEPERQSTKPRKWFSRLVVGDSEVPEVDLLGVVQALVRSFGIFKEVADPEGGEVRGDLRKTCDVVLTHPGIQESTHEDAMITMRPFWILWQDGHSAYPGQVLCARYVGPDATDERPCGGFLIVGRHPAGSYPDRFAWCHRHVAAI